MIPHIIHQTYVTKDVPSSCKSYIEKLISLHPNWSYRFYDDTACDHLIKSYFPELYHAFQSSNYPIVKADIFRIAVVYLHGGFYFDIDMDFHQSIESLCDKRAVFAIENKMSEEDCSRLGVIQPIRIANYAFGAEMAHPFLYHLIEKLIVKQEKVLDLRTEDDILNYSGPGFVTESFHSQSHSDIHLLELPDRLCSKCLSQRCQFGKYASHDHMGSWRWESNSFHSD